MPSGFALLEVLAALTLLAIAGISLLELALQCAAAARSAGESAQNALLANRFLENVALWPRSDLDRHLGHRREGAFLMIVERPTPTLYRVRLVTPGHSGVPDRQLLTTLLYRGAP